MEKGKSYGILDYFIYYIHTLYYKEPKLPHQIGRKNAMQHKRPATHPRTKLLVYC